MFHCHSRSNDSNRKKNTKKLKSEILQTSLDVCNTTKHKDDFNLKENLMNYKLHVFKGDPVKPILDKTVCNKSEENKTFKEPVNSENYDRNAIKRNYNLKNINMIRLNILVDQAIEERKKLIHKGFAYLKKKNTNEKSNYFITKFSDISTDIFELDVKDDMTLYKCAWNGCKKSFPSTTRAKRHYISHLNIRPFLCPAVGCPKDFIRKDNMMQHYRTHFKKGFKGGRSNDNRKI